jgi:hypothetical protein
MMGALFTMMVNLSRNERKEEMTKNTTLEEVSASLGYPSVSHQIKQIDLATEVVKESLKKNGNSFECNVPRIGDCAKFIGLTIESDGHHSPSDIKDIEIIIGPTTYVRIPYNILLALADVKTSGTKTHIKIDFSAFIRELIMIRMEYMCVRVRINCAETNNIKGVTLHTEYTYRNTEVRRQFARAKLSESVIQTFETIEPTKTEDGITFTTPVRPETGYLKGIVIEYPVEQIENVQMMVGKNDRYNYDKDDLFFNAQQLSESLLFIPFTNSASLTSTEMPTSSGLFSMHGLRYMEFYSSDTGIAQSQKRIQCCPDHINAAANITSISAEEIDKIVREGNDEVGKRFTPVVTIKTSDAAYTNSPRIHAVNINVYQVKSGCASLVDFLNDD